jgi:glycyl-tRNA synthetase beta chain
MAKFLFEIGLEEIPARMIADAEAELARRVTELLSREKLLSETHAVASYSSPRRLAVLIDGVIAKQADSEDQLTGPAAKIAYKDGEPTPAAHAFARKAGVDVAALTILTTTKGDYVSAVISKHGKTATAVLAEQLPREVAQLYWAKNMYWRPGKPERFVRPLQWMVALLDEDIVPIQFGGVTASHQTYGHRVLHGEAPVTIARPADYLQLLECAFVLADVAVRRQRTRKALDAATRTVPGVRWREDEPLVETVTHLTEWPSVVLGGFEPEYLTLPEEVLVTVMRDHQKYFAVEDSEHKLAPYFLALLNTEVDEQGLEIIRHGNARVLRARFNDARFFWNYDQKTSLEARIELLRQVTFQKELGSYFEKTEANGRVAGALADRASTQHVEFDREALLNAVRLAKTDLTAELVKEFTELQGIVGGLYARAQGHGEAVAMAIYSQYQPASMDAAIPSTVEGQLLGLADRMQTIVAMFSIGLEPTGSKDPFALRRAANGVIKILAETSLPFTVSELTKAAADVPSYEPKSEKTETNEAAVTAFLKERLEFYLRDVRDFRYDVVNAVLATNADDVPDAIARAEALTAVRGSQDFVAVSSAFKRIKNILRQAAEKGSVHAGSAVLAENLIEPEERELHAAALRLAPQVEKLQAGRDYRGALETTAQLRPVIDAFFDKVMVMAPDEKLRNNRLALIAHVLKDFSRIGDVSEIIAG